MFLHYISHIKDKENVLLFYMPKLVSWFSNQVTPGHRDIDKSYQGQMKALRDKHK